MQNIMTVNTSELIWQSEYLQVGTFTVIRKRRRDVKYKERQVQLPQY